MAQRYDLIIFGSGFGGSLMSMVAKRIGLRVLLIERGTHPRFAIGESTSPLTNLLLEEIAVKYDLPFLIPFTTHGAWQRSYPDISVGLKRGFTYYHHKRGERFARANDRSNQLMVAASPSNEVSDTHWYRAEFDHFMVKKAVELEVDYLDRTDIASIDRAPGGWAVIGKCQGNPIELSASFIIDATGPRGLFTRLLNIPEAELEGVRPSQALFTHFVGAARCDDSEEYSVPGSPPFAPDDAALHHVFEGGWLWALRFGNGITSAGFSVSDEAAADLGLPGNPQAAWQNFLKTYPSVGAQFKEATPTTPLIYSPRLGFRTSQAAGVGWAMLPSAAGFIDPLFSTGIPLTLLGIERIGRLLAEGWGRDGFDECLAEFGETTLQELDATAHFVGASLRSTGCFPVFAAFSMFYFAAASYSEMARRLDKSHLVRRFLAADRSDFRAGMHQCMDAMPGVIADPTPFSIHEFESLVAESIGCLNIAGLADPQKRNWYGVDLEDVVRNSQKLEMTPEGVSQIIATAPWARS